MSFITIKESHYVSDLFILKSKLESEGIDCHIDDENTSMVLAHLPSITAKLKVSEKDLPQVKSILIEMGELENQEEIHCPRCGSNKYKIKLNIVNMLKIIIALILGLFTFRPLGIKYKSNEVKCQECGAIFKLK